MTRERTLRILAGAVLLWGSVAFVSTSVFAPAPPGDPDCYISARWTGDAWDYGAWTCFENGLPPIRDLRIAPEVTFDPLEAWREMDVDVLADVALGEDPRAVAAVVWTVLNRAKKTHENCPSGRWDVNLPARGEPRPNVEAEATTLSSCVSFTLFEAVIRHRRSFGSVIGGRFHPAWSQVPGRRWSRWYPDDWWRARRIARAVLEGRLPDPTGGATHFHREGTWRPPWAPEPTSWVSIGHHAFYQAS